MSNDMQARIDDLEDLLKRALGQLLHMAYRAQKGHETLVAGQLLAESVCRIYSAGPTLDDIIASRILVDEIGKRFPASPEEAEQ